ncbi:MAG: DUF2065 domain-containing protein [Gammaproteobacteria bacterium]|nr:DUF2065 domain-containing protein [Gammaproteobacteria bacterium]
MWDSLWIALGLVLVIEGLLPSLNPKAFKQTMSTIRELDEGTLRIMGLISMTIGATIVYFLTQ